MTISAVSHFEQKRKYFVQFTEKSEFLKRIFEMARNRIEKFSTLKTINKSDK